MIIREVRRLFGIDIEVRGTEHLNGEEPAVVVANHQTSLDFLGELFMCVCLCVTWAACVCLCVCVCACVHVTV